MQQVACFCMLCYTVMLYNLYYYVLYVPNSPVINISTGIENYHRSLIRHSFPNATLMICLSWPTVPSSVFSKDLGWSFEFRWFDCGIHFAPTLGMELFIVTVIGIQPCYFPNCANYLHSLIFHYHIRVFSLQVRIVVNLEAIGGELVPDGMPQGTGSQGTNHKHLHLFCIVSKLTCTFLY